MKQVNIENINERIAQLKTSEHIGGVLSIQQQFELACLRELVAVTEQRDALVVEMAALNSGDCFFSYGSEHGFEWHKTAKEAAENAEAAIDDYRGDACDGWSEEVSSICWGVIMQSSTMVGERPRTEDDCVDSAIDTICDYALLPAIETPATDAAIAALRAEGLDSAFDEEPFGTVRRYGDQVVIDLNGDPHIKDGMPVFARQLRESKGEVSNG